jgi:hypothetical protein
MKILLFKLTQDSDLHEDLTICYKDKNGVYSKIGTITDVFTSENTTYYLLHNAMGSYTADELKLICN